MKKGSQIYVAGHKGMVGSAIVRKLTSVGYKNIIKRDSAELDLRDQSAVKAFFKSERPEYVFLAAAKVGGIMANDTYRAEFLYDNLMIGANVIHASYENEVEKLLFLGSSCIYPKYAEQPIAETSLLTGSLEPTNEPYAIAKIASLKMCETYRDQYGSNFISVQPTNLYGPGDNYDPQDSHVIPGLIRRFHEAKITQQDQLTIWGTGSPLREFLHVDDLADACMFLMEHYNGKAPVNVGSGEEVSILQLATLIKEVVGYQGEILHDLSKPDGTPRKLLSTEMLDALGWTASTKLKAGLQSTYLSFQKEAA